MTPPYSVAIIEDSDETRERLLGIFNHSNDFQCRISFASGHAGLAHFQSPNCELPDLVLVDLGLPDMHGVQCIKQLRKINQAVKLVVFTVFEDVHSIFQSLQCGANGYLLKDISEELFLAELRVVMLGGSSLTPAVANRILKAEPDLDSESGAMLLSKRELEVLELIALGLTYNEISARLGISPNTVRNHIQNMYRALNVNSGTSAIREGRKLGYLP